MSTYHILPKNKISTIVEDHRDLPVHSPDAGKWYCAFTWEPSEDTYVAGGIAKYMGNDVWIDDSNSNGDIIDNSIEFKWCDYLVIQE